jgi:hypothetical protein
MEKARAVLREESVLLRLLTEGVYICVVVRGE